jgi:hypothetical protein
MKTTKTYLGKAGKIYGPFTEQEMETMRSNGLIRDFVWIWVADAKTWKCLDIPPPAPDEEEEAPRASTAASGASAASTVTPPPPPGSARTAKPAASSGKKRGWNKLHAICHDQMNVVTGTLAGVTETGCELIVTNSIEGQGLASHAQINITLVDLSDDRSMRVRARVVAVNRENGQWVYRLSWPEAPAWFGEKAA